jgi:hypothetical protein
MRYKTELYAKEQAEIVEQIISILQLDDQHSITLYELEQDDHKKKQLMDLVPTIRQFFSFSNCVGVSKPSKVERPWLSLIRIIPKNHYHMYSCDYVWKNDGQRIRTKRYVFQKCT